MNQPEYTPAFREEQTGYMRHRIKQVGENEELPEEIGTFRLGSAQIINIKPPRVGGPLESIKIHDFCQQRGVPVWCGGVMETGIGRAFNIALASKAGFTLPADMSEIRLFYPEDLVRDPFEIKNGLIQVRTQPGLGFEINEPAIEKYTVNKIRIKPR